MLYYYFKKFNSYLGLDKAIAYSSGARVVQGVTGVASVFFITTYLSGVEQGFYYTFGSILALQVFFELGLTGIMTQYVAHEVSHLSLNPDGCYSGDNTYKSRLSSLVHFCVKWYAILAIIVFVFLFVVGFLFFSRYSFNESGVDWVLPWLLVCCGTALKLFQSPFNSFFMGIGKVKEMSKIGFYQQIIIPLSTWLGLAFGWKLYVAGLGYILSVIVWQIYVQKLHLMNILIKLWNFKITERILYFKEIFPYQWRIALSWLSGYFNFQLFNPVLFATEGAIVAGQMGMTLHAINAIQAFSMSWISTKIPLYSQLIALKDYIKLDKYFNSSVRQMTSVCLLLVILFFLLICFLNYTQLKVGDNVLAERFLSYIPLLLMLFPVYLQQYINAWATYLRCHKKEPFLVNSICSGLTSCFCILFFGRYFGLYGITLSNFFITVLFFPWGYWIFKTKKKEWHGE